MKKLLFCTIALLMAAAANAQVSITTGCPLKAKIAGVDFSEGSLRITLILTNTTSSDFSVRFLEGAAIAKDDEGYSYNEQNAKFGVIQQGQRMDYNRYFGAPDIEFIAEDNNRIILQVNGIKKNASSLSLLRIPIASSQLGISYSTYDNEKVNNRYLTIKNLEWEK